MFTKLGNHPHLLLELLHYSQRISAHEQSLSLTPLLPAQGKHQSTFIFWAWTILDISCMQDRVWTFASDSLCEGFQVICCITLFSISIPGILLCCIDIPHIVCPFDIDGHWQCFYFGLWGAMLISTVMSKLFFPRPQIFTSLAYVPKITIRLW